VATPPDPHDRKLLAKRDFAIPTPGLTALGLWSEAPSALDIPEADDERENVDDDLEE
jgi:hypothetical protein